MTTAGFLVKFWKITTPERRNPAMDFHCIEMLLNLPEFRVIDQVIRPRELQLSLERRDSYLVCPHCQGCCSRIKESRERCIRDLPILDRPVTLQVHIRRFKCSDCHHRPWEKSETFGERIKWTDRLYHRVRRVAGKIRSKYTLREKTLQIKSLGAIFDWFSTQSSRIRHGKRVAALVSSRLPRI